MLKKNIDRNQRKQRRNTWEGYYTRVVRDKTKYTRKNKHKVSYVF